MRPRRLGLVAACGALGLIGIAAGLARFGAPSVENGEPFIEVALPATEHGADRVLVASSGPDRSPDSRPVLPLALAPERVASLSLPDMVQDEAREVFALSVERADRSGVALWSPEPHQPPVAPLHR